MIRNQTTRYFDRFTGAWARFGQFIREVNTGLVALHRVQFETPWKPAHRPTYGEW